MSSNTISQLPEDVVTILKKWNTQIIYQQKKHLSLGLRYNFIYYLIGIPCTILNATYASTSLANVSSCSDKLCVFQILTSLISAILSALLVFLNLQTKSEEHKTTYSRLSALNRTIDTILSIPNKGDPQDILNNVKTAYDFISDDEPLIKISEKFENINIHPHLEIKPDPEFEFQLQRFYENV